MRKVTCGGSENFVFTENFQIDNVPGIFMSYEVIMKDALGVCKGIKEQSSPSDMILVPVRIYSKEATLRFD